MFKMLNKTDIYEEATKRFGPPNHSRSTQKELRFGSRGSKKVDLATGRWHDFELGEGGFLFSSRKRDRRLLGPKPTGQSNKAPRIAAALKLFANSQKITGTISESYLRMARGVTTTLCGDLRFHPSCPCRDRQAPAMVALIRNIETNEPQGVHRTFLRADGRGRVDLKMMLGLARNGVVKLSPDAEVTYGLGIAEGIETGLAVLSTGWAPVWSALSAGGISGFPVLNGIEDLTIFADADPAGKSAAEKCARRWSDAGRHVFIRVPNKGDWNDFS